MFLEHEKKTFFSSLATTRSGGVGQGHAVPRSGRSAAKSPRHPAAAAGGGVTLGMLT